MSDYYRDYSEDSSGSSSGASSYFSEGSPDPKPPKKHPILKALAFVLCLGIVGAGSVQIYKFINDNRLQCSETSASADEVNKAQSSDGSADTVSRAPYDGDLPSLIEIASRDDAKSLPDIVDEIMPSVVGISSTFEITETYSSWGWMGIQPESRTRQAIGTGTGIVMTEDGYIVTNAHVVYDDSEYDAGEAVAVSVVFSDESEHEAKIIAYDVETDIAVLKIDEAGLTPATFGDSSDLRVGELVIAVGNPLGFDLFGSVTSGIVSALNRHISINEKNMTLIQTDAAINSGNSGGPLLNSCGQVIGINSAKMSSSYGSASVEGLGFAIPINEAKVIIDDLISNGYVTGRPQIGITTVDISEAYSRYLNIPMGVYVRDVAEGSAAEAAGLKTGDIIMEIEGTTVTTAEELNAVKNNFKAGDTIELTVNRDGEDITVMVTLQDAQAGSGKNRSPLDRETDTSEN